MGRQKWEGSIGVGGKKLQYYMKLCESFENCKALKNLKNHPNFKIFLKILKENSEICLIHDRDLSPNHEANRVHVLF